MSDVEIKIDLPDVDENIIAKLSCSITLLLFFDPVTTSDGQIYERQAITHWLQTNTTSPNTGKPITKNLIPMIYIKNEVNDLLKKYPHLKSEQYVVKNELTQATEQAPKSEFLINPEITLLRYQMMQALEQMSLSTEFATIGDIRRILQQFDHLIQLIQEQEQTPEIIIDLENLQRIKHLVVKLYCIKRFNEFCRTHELATNETLQKYVQKCDQLKQELQQQEQTFDTMQQIEVFETIQQLFINRIHRRGIVQDQIEPAVNNRQQPEAENENEDHDNALYEAFCFCCKEIFIIMIIIAVLITALVYSFKKI